MEETTYYLAVDIGASSGRHILGWIDHGKIRTEELYRFENKLERQGDFLCWNMDHLYSEVVEGLKKAGRLKRIPKSVAIDTWGVDFVLLDEHGNRLGQAVSYRDSRTDGMDTEVYKIVSEKDLYARTGIQKQIFNTIFQLMAIKQTESQILERAEHFLMIPEYLNYLLTGVVKNEYTNATTTGLVNAETADWDLDLIESLGYPAKIFGKLYMPKETVGHFTERIAGLVGYRAEVILPATHDTASAVLAVPTNDENTIYLSSGTWSLMGIEKMIPDTTEEARRHNFTNEGGYHHRYRFLKNIMGLWMMQNIRKEFKHAYTFDELFTLAHIGRYFTTTVNVNAKQFLAPASMIGAVRAYAKELDKEIPETECEILYCVYRSLAECYRDTVAEIETVTKKKYSRIHVIGGGAQDRFLNTLIKETTGKEVYAGPIEATALGNLLCQMLRDNVFDDLPAARSCIKKSFDIKAV